MVVLKLIFTKAGNDWWELYKNKWEAIIESLIISAISFFLFLPKMIDPNEMSIELRVTIAVLASSLVWAIIRFLGYLLLAPFRVIKGQWKELTKHQFEEITIDEYRPSKNLVEKPGLVIRNKKSYILEKCSCRLVSLQMNNMMLSLEPPPPPLGWIIESKLHFDSIDIPPHEKRIVAVQAWDRPIVGKIIHVSLGNGKKDLGASVGLEFGGKYGIGIRENNYYKAGFVFNFTIEGKNISSPVKYFGVRLVGNDLKFKKL